MERTRTSSILNAVTVPTLLLDERRARRNIAKMAAKCRASGTMLRPHFKTHQSAAVGEWFRDEGVTAITVSSVRMAAYFADHGWDDIVVAFPLNWREMDVINSLASHVRLGVILDVPESAAFLGERVTSPLDVWIEVDTGYPRTGVRWDDSERMLAIANGVKQSSMLTLRGLLAHNGRSYACRGEAALRSFWAEAVEKVRTAQAVLGEHGFPGLAISPGDTPCCNVVEDFAGIEEIRPGNFVYNDLMQVVNGSCSEDDVAVAVACPVVSKHADRMQIAIYGGGVHLSKDYYIDQQGRTTYGAVAFPTEDGWGRSVQDAWVMSVSQEHGIIQCDKDTFDRVSIGDLLIVIPVHSCMTADLLKQAVTLSGNVVDMLVLS